MEIQLDEVKQSSRYKDNLHAAENNPGNRTQYKIEQMCLRGSAGEIAAYNFINQNVANCIYNPHYDNINMACAFDLLTRLYRIEVKTIIAGKDPAFYAKQMFNDNGEDGFDLTTALKYNKADFILIMKSEERDGVLKIVPLMMVNLSRIGEIANKSKWNGYYINRDIETIEDVVYNGISAIVDRLKK